jgi:hypothetical protein
LSNPLPTATAERVVCAPAREPVIEAFPGLATNLGGLAITRLLPRSRRRLVGPWCFFDAFGPLRFDSGKPVDVPPHPHIGLQTVSWVIEGEILHNDSLGLTGMARPGVVNVMTAGQGIAHAEETPPSNTGRLAGVQLWVALPDVSRHIAASFEAHGTLPTLRLESATATVFLGQLGEVRAPGRVHSPLVGVDVLASGDSDFRLPLDPSFEHAVVVMSGAWRLADGPLEPQTLYYLGCGRSELRLAAAGSAGSARLLLLGGAPFGEDVLMWWNFVARTSDEIVAAREDWEANRRFGEVAAYDGLRLSAPPFVARPVIGR